MSNKEDEGKLELSLRVLGNEIIGFKMIVDDFKTFPVTKQFDSPPLRMLEGGGDGAVPPSASSFDMEEVPLNQIFQKAVVLQRSGDRSGAIREYEQFLTVAKSCDVDPSLYVSGC